MVKLRLKRMGSKYNAFYRIVAADSRSPRDGKYIEELGFYNPHSKEIRINTEIKNKWLAEGAVPSETVKKLFAKYEKQGANGEVTKLQVKEKKVKEAPAVEVTAPVEETTTESTETTAEEVKEAPATEEVQQEAPAEEPKA